MTRIYAQIIRRIRTAEMTKYSERAERRKPFLFNFIRAFRVTYIFTKIRIRLWKTRECLGFEAAIRKFSREFARTSDRWSIFQPSFVFQLAPILNVTFRRNFPCRLSRKIAKNFEVGVKCVGSYSSKMCHSVSTWWMGICDRAYEKWARGEMESRNVSSAWYHWWWRPIESSWRYFYKLFVVFWLSCFFYL